MKWGKLNLEVDGAYALDYYSILLVKWNKTGNPNINQEVSNCRELLINQLSLSFWQQITSSKEWADLLKKNEEVFDAVSLAKTDNITASKVDQLNVDRWRIKQKIQSQFFNMDLVETKV